MYIYIYTLYAYHHLSMGTAQWQKLFWFECMWSPHFILEAWRELRYSFGGSHSECWCSVASLLLVALSFLAIGFWIGGTVTALVLSPRLRSFLHHLVRFCLFAATDLVPPVGERQLATRDRLREYRAWALATLHLWKPRNLGLDLKLTAGNLWTPRAVRFLRLVLLSSLSLWWGGGLVRIIRGRKRCLFFLWGWLTGIVCWLALTCRGSASFLFLH